MQQISIVLADSQHLIRLGLRHLLANREEFSIVAEATNEQSLFQQLDEHKPRVVIVDYDQPGSFSEETIRHIRQKAPFSKVLVISGDNEKNSIYQVLEYGINSFLTKTCGQEEILDAVKATAKGEKFFCTKVLDYLLEKSFSKVEDNCEPTPLTPREIEIVRLVAKGLIAKEIASMLNLSTHTVYTHRKNIMKKLSLNTSSELVLYAINNGIVESN